MLTPAAPVDGLLLMSISELARQKSVSKQAVSKRVNALAQAGKLQKHSGRHGTVLVSLAEYDRAVGETTDLAKETGNATRAPPPETNDAPASTYTYEQTRAKRLEADLRQLELDERLGKLVPVDQIADAGRRIAEVLLRALDQLPSHAADVSVAVAKDGEAGARVWLRQTSNDLRAALTKALTDLLPPDPQE